MVLFWWREMSQTEAHIGACTQFVHSIFKLGTEQAGNYYVILYTFFVWLK
jgi:hypothetical protein